MTNANIQRLCIISTCVFCAVLICFLSICCHLFRFIVVIFVVITCLISFQFIHAVLISATILFNFFKFFFFGFRFVLSVFISIIKAAKGASEGLNLKMTAAELRAKLAAKKKYDPKNDSVDLRKKYEIVQKL